MKNLIIMSVFSLFIFSCDDDNPVVPENVYGCTDSSSCSYDPNVNVYVPDSCLELDECGECGGDNESMDECGNCDGEDLEYVYLWGNCYNIESTIELYLDNDKLTGEIPVEIGNLTNLKKLYLNDNQLTGEIPSSIGYLTNLEELRLFDNQLTGEIPIEICNQGDGTPSVGNNQLCPPYPSCISQSDIDSQECLDDCGVPNGNNQTMDCGGSCNEEYVELWDECYNIQTTTGIYHDGSSMGVLSGEIPSEIGDLTNLTGIYLRYNQLTGEIPSSIGNLTNLISLELSLNQLTGEIPSSIGNLTNLYQLYLYDNQLTGEIPSSIGNLTNLTFLELSSNQLTGEIPSSIGNLTNLEYLSLSNNQLTVEIPSSIGNLTNLNYLYLDDNQLTGEIPESICSLTNLNWSSFWNNLSWYHESYIYNNQLCPPYPECIQDYIGTQNTSNCP